MDTLQRKLMIVGAWSGIVTLFFFLVGWFIFADFIPPHPPSEGAEAIAERLRSNFYQIRIAMIMQMMAAGTTIVFSVALGALITEIEGRSGILANTTMLSGYGLSLLFFYPAMWWLTAVFRPERDAELLFLINDAAWLQFVGGLFIGWLLFVGPAIAAFVKQEPTSLLPRWYGYFSAWVAVLFLPAQLLFFVKSGPLAWNGLISLYVPLFVFVVWVPVTAYYMRKAGKGA